MFFRSRSWMYRTPWLCALLLEWPVTSTGGSFGHAPPLCPRGPLWPAHTARTVRAAGHRDGDGAIYSSCVAIPMREAHQSDRASPSCAFPGFHSSAGHSSPVHPTSLGLARDPGPDLARYRRWPPCSWSAVLGSVGRGSGAQQLELSSPAAPRAVSYFAASPDPKAAPGGFHRRTQSQLSVPCGRRGPFPRRIGADRRPEPESVSSDGDSRPGCTPAAPSVGLQPTGSRWQKTAPVRRPDLRATCSVAPPVQQAPNVGPRSFCSQGTSCRPMPASRQAPAVPAAIIAAIVSPDAAPLKLG